MPSPSWRGCNTPPTTAAAGKVVSSAPMSLPRSLVLPGTPLLNEPMSRRKRLRYWLGTGLPKRLAGFFSVKISEPAGGEVKSFRLTVQLLPPWQFMQPALEKRVRPRLMSDADGAFGRPGMGALGGRRALRTHSRRAVRAGTLLALPGSVTES